MAPEELQAHFYRDGKVNLMRAMFHPQGFRLFVLNWDDFSVHLLQRLHREAIAEGESEQSKALLDKLMSYPGAEKLEKQP